MKLIKSSVQKVSLGLFSVMANYAFFAKAAFAAPNCRPGKDGGVLDGVECAAQGSSVENVELVGPNGLFQRIINILLFAVGAISVVMLIIGGIRYVISSGDQNAVTAAKNTILYAIIGLVVAFLAYGAVRFVVSSLTPDGAV